MVQALCYMFYTLSINESQLFKSKVFTQVIDGKQARSAINKLSMATLNK